jgi:transcriptional regulator with XRE-family HTH domain
MVTFRRLNRWSLDAHVARDPLGRSRSIIARDTDIARSTLTDLLTGRRDASLELIERLADTLDVDHRALVTDPHGVFPALSRIAESARALAPHINGHDFGLRDALAELDRVAS